VEKFEKLVAKAGFTVQKSMLTFKVAICVIQCGEKNPIAFQKL
jgi:hypothetical protein